MDGLDDCDVYWSGGARSVDYFVCHGGRIGRNWQEYQAGGVVIEVRSKWRWFGGWWWLATTLPSGVLRVNCYY